MTKKVTQSRQPQGRWRAYLPTVFRTHQKHRGRRGDAHARVVRLPRIDHGHHSDHGKRRHGLPHHRRCLAQQDTNHAGRRFLYRHHRTAGRLGQADGRSGLSAARQLPTGGHTHHGHIIGEAHPIILSQRPFQHVRHEGSTARAQASTRSVHSRGKEKTIEIIQNDRFCRSF